MTTTTRTCATCRHWRDSGQSVLRAALHWGECRIDAPSLGNPIDGNGQPLTAGEPHWGVWPATAPSDFCGEHEAREEARRKAA
jgi:hypothetical protein